MTNVMRRMAMANAKKRTGLAFPQRSRPTVEGGHYKFRDEKPILVRRDRFKR